MGDRGEFFLYFELIHSWQMSLVDSSFKQIKPCLERLEVAWPVVWRHWIGWSRIPIQPMEKILLQG